MTIVTDNVHLIIIIIHYRLIRHNIVMMLASTYIQEFAIITYVRYIHGV